MISILVPTYNERGNLHRLFERIDETMRRGAEEYEVILVDDDSPDGTYDLACELTDQYPITPVRRTEQSGLATAVVHGMGIANGDRLVVMDADLQHPPERIPALVDQLSTADIVVGSRLVDTGSFGDFSLLRRIDTYGANVLAWLLLPDTREVLDVQSGFFAIDRTAVETGDLSPTGFKILLEILVVAEYDTVAELGYEFRERSAGESNLGLDTILDYVRHLGDLWIRRRNVANSSNPDARTADGAVASVSAFLRE